MLELRAGRSHEDALRRMADRAGADDIRAFATLLIQSIKLGSSIAQTLRTYASEMREKRRLRAEEKAHRLPVLISIPLVACMLPTMIGVLMLPAAIRVIRAILPALSGGLDMKRGEMIAWTLCASGVLLTAACTTGTRGTKIRAIESASSKIKGGPAALAEAQGLLNLGNPGLALEAFRKVQRDQPGADALAGIAACYVAMGRDDLAKTNLEAALALAPQSPELLQSIALVMDRLGLKTEAANAQQRAREILAQSDPPTLAKVVAITVEGPIELHGSAAPLPDLDVAATSQPIMPATDAALAEDRDIARAVAEARRLVEAQNLTSTVTVKLPPARMALPTPRPASPRLERLSPKEVALLTSDRSYWAPRRDKRVQTALVDTRWKPLPREASLPNIRLLNAARVQGLASAARSGLLQRGWRKIEVGDHTSVRTRSVVLYPADKQRIGQSLAKHFGINSAQSKVRTVTVILGRDRAARRHG